MTTRRLVKALQSLQSFLKTICSFRSCPSSQSKFHKGKLDTGHARLPRYKNALKVILCASCPPQTAIVNMGLSCAFLPLISIFSRGKKKKRLQETDEASDDTRGRAQMHQVPDADGAGGELMWRSMRWGQEEESNSPMVKSQRTSQDLVRADAKGKGPAVLKKTSHELRRFNRLGSATSSNSTTSSPLTASTPSAAATTTSLIPFAQPSQPRRSASTTSTQRRHFRQGSNGTANPEILGTQASARSNLVNYSGLAHLTRLVDEEALGLSPYLVDNSRSVAEADRRYGIGVRTECTVFEESAERTS